MKCNACGMESAISGKFCPNCGAAVLPDGPLNVQTTTAATFSKAGVIGALAGALALAGAGGYIYYDKQQDKARMEAERVAEQKRAVDIAERDKKLAEERAARERESAARLAAEKQAKALAQQKAEADARARAAEDHAKKAAAAAATAKAAPPPPPPPPPPPRSGAVLTTERSAPLIRSMVSAAIAGDEGGIQRFRGNIEALPKPLAGDRAVAGAARQAAVEAFKRGDTQSALDRYQYAIAADPTDIAAYTGLGQVYNRLGRYADADAAFSRALTLAPASAAAWTNFGMALARSGNTPNAAGALVNSYVFAADRQRAYEGLQRMANSRDGNVSAAAARALQSRLVTAAR